MPISKRMLTKWRKEALNTAGFWNGRDINSMVRSEVKNLEDAKRILLLTQELLDQALLKEK